MKKLIGLSMLLLVVLSFSGFTFKDTTDSFLSYLRRPIDLGIDVAVKAMNGTEKVFANLSTTVLNGANLMRDTANDLYTDITVRK